MMKKKWEFYWKQTLINMWCRKKYLFRILINIFYKKETSIYEGIVMNIYIERDGVLYNINRRI